MNRIRPSREVVLLYLCTLCLSFGACILSRPAKQTPVINYPDLVITMERGPCFGTCPVYQLTIFGDGRVIYNGKDSVAAYGQETSKLCWFQVRELVNAFEKADFFSLQDAYRIPVYDLPSVTLSITINRRSKSIYHYGDLTCRGSLEGWHDLAPKQLCDLEEKIDAVVNSYQWVRRK